MSQRELVVIQLEENGNLSYSINPDASLHSVVGALQIVRRVLEAKMVSEALSGKSPENTNQNDNQSNQSSSNPS